MSIYYDAESLNGNMLGKAVPRPTAALPAGTSEALFTIAGGRVAVTHIIGEVITAIQNQANDTKLIANPTTGPAVDLCAALDIADDAVGTLYSITGDFSDGMKDGLLCLETDAQLERPLILSEGAIELDCAATNTGAVQWTVYYVPLDDGATLVVA